MTLSYGGIIRKHPEAVELLRGICLILQGLVITVKGLGNGSSDIFDHIFHGQKPPSEGWGELLDQGIQILAGQGNSFTNIVLELHAKNLLSSIKTSARSLGKYWETVYTNS